MKQLAMLAALVAVSTSGCLLTAASSKVIRQDEPVFDVRYASPQAEGTFLACVAKPEASDGEKSGSFIGVPFLFAWAKSSKLSKNAIYNDQVILCDTNADGLITDLEAQQFRDRFFPGTEANPALTVEQVVSDDEAGGTKIEVGGVPMQASYSSDATDQ